MEPQNKDQLIYEEIIQKGYQQEMFNVFLKALSSPFKSVALRSNKYLSQVSNKY